MHEDDRADEPRADEPATESAEEAAWREIVANYGERVLEEPDDPVTDDSVILSFGDDGSAPDEVDGENPLDLAESEQFVPPTPALPRTTPERFMAWLGVLGTPVIAVLLVTIHTVTGFDFPSWVIAFLVLAFLGGFGYLLVTMSRDPGDPWDDGARV
ncbi:hypothetical protein [Nocardioides sp. KR10-350]|uniref:hypothetical protein n=1 Tax=Nocardioides cheoyonin TaxID=3156615 RepID=UPI0032B4555B